MKNLELNISFTNWVMSSVFVEKNIFNKLWNKIQLKNITTFQNLKQINIELWNEVIETQNTALLDVNYKYGKKYNASQLKLLDKTFSRLYDDYFLALNNRRAKSNLERSQEKTTLSLKLIVLENAIQTLEFIGRNQRFLKDYMEKERKVYDSVKIVAKNVQFKPFNTIQENIDILKKVLKSNELEYQRKFGDDKEQENNYSFEKQLIDIENVLGRSLDVKNCNVIKWIEYLNKVEQIIQQKESNGRRNR